MFEGLKKAGANIAEKIKNIKIPDAKQMRKSRENLKTVTPDPKNIPTAEVAKNSWSSLDSVNIGLKFESEDENILEIQNHLDGINESLQNPNNSKKENDELYNYQLQLHQTISGIRKGSGEPKSEDTFDQGVSKNSVEPSQGETSLSREGTTHFELLDKMSKKAKFVNINNNSSLENITFSFKDKLKNLFSKNKKIETYSMKTQAEYKAIKIEDAERKAREEAVAQARKVAEAEKNLETVRRVSGIDKLNEGQRSVRNLVGSSK